MPGVKQERLRTGNSKFAVIRTFHEATSTWSIATWVGPQRAENVLLDFMFKGPSRHLRVRVHGVGKPHFALCGAPLEGHRTSAPLDGPEEIDRMQTLCSECSDRLAELPLD